MGIDPLRRFDEVADEVARTIDDGKATDLLLLSPPTSPDLSAARRARQPVRGQEAGGRGAAVSPATVASKNMESMINTWRGWVCLIVTALSILIVLQQPRLVFFWKPVGARLAWEETGLPGTLLAGFFGEQQRDPNPHPHPHPHPQPHPNPHPHPHPHPAPAVTACPSG